MDDDSVVDGTSVVDAAVIDLDRAGPQPVSPTARRWRRWTAPKMPIVVAIALMLLIGAGAGFGTEQWATRDPRASVSVVVVPGEVAFQVDTDRGQVSLDGLLTVVNAGPRPITVKGLRMDPAGAEITQSLNLSIAPGKSVLVTAIIWYDCPATHSMATQIAVDFKPSISVQVEGGARQAVGFSANQWAQDMVMSCVSWSATS